MPNVTVMTPIQAEQYMRAAGISTSQETIRLGLQQKVFPFGDCIQTDKSAVYYIYKRKLDEWLAERQEEVHDETWGNH